MQNRFLSTGRCGKHLKKNYIVEKKDVFLGNWYVLTGTNWPREIIFFDKNDFMIEGDLSNWWMAF